MKYLRRASHVLRNRYVILTIRHLNSPSLRRLVTSTSTMASSSLPNINVTPAASQHILHDGEEYTTIKEGLAFILTPASASKVPQTSPKGENQVQSVFYNPIQQFNRDLSVLAIKAYGEEVLERKKRDSAISRQKWKEKIAAKRAKKRKRTDDDALSGDGSRKAGKVDTNDTPVMNIGTEVNPEPVQNELAVSESDDTAATAELNTASATMYNAVADESEAQSKTAEHSAVSIGPDAAVISNSVSDLPEQQIAQPENHEGNSEIEPKPPAFTILDALSATGLRALRYAQEIPFSTSITANDLLETATKTIKLNVKHNKLEDKIKPVTSNALAHMYSFVERGEEVDQNGNKISSRKYDVIDLDPYGTAAPFLDAAVQSVRDGGLLCVTCTDSGIWASNGYPEKTYSLYGGFPVKGQHSHEAGLRLILHAIATVAARYGLAIEPLLSLSIDFYARVFVRVVKSPADVKFLAGKTMIVYNCDSGCGAWTTQLLGKNKLVPNKNGKGHFYKHVLSAGPTMHDHCEHCGFKRHVGGPMYAGPIQSPEFIQRILEGLPHVSKDTYATTSRIEGMLTTALEEMLPAIPLPDAEMPDFITKTGTRLPDPAAIDNYPFFFIPSVLSKVIHCVTPHEDAIRGALRHLGYRVTRSHAKAGSIKTDAPWDVIWEIMREWVKQKAPVKEASIREGTAAYTILGLDKAKGTPQKETNNGATNGTKKEPQPTDADNSTAEAEVKETKREIVFDEKLGREVDSKKLVRFQINPRENWGPMTRAKGGGGGGGNS